MNRRFEKEAVAELYSKYRPNYDDSGLHEMILKYLMNGEHKVRIFNILLLEFQS